MSKVGQVALRFFVFLSLYTAAHWFGWVEGPWSVAAIAALLVSVFVTFVMPDRTGRQRG